jgi:hypothetical protein
MKNGGEKLWWKEAIKKNVWMTSFGLLKIWLICCVKL